MHRRVMLATITAVTVTIVLLGVPLAIFGSMMLRDAELRELEVRRDNLARIVESRISEPSDTAIRNSGSNQDKSAQRPITPRTLKPSIGGEGTIEASVLVILPDNTEVRAGERISGRSIVSTDTTASGAVVVLTISWWDIAWRMARVVGLVVLASIVAFGVGLWMARWQARRLSGPLVLLAASAEQLGTGQTRPRLQPSGTEEIDLVAAELGRSADRMAARLAVERQFASDASHQLRTPLTALMMRLEEIIAGSQEDFVVEEAKISLEQVERLVNVVDDLLNRSRRMEGGTTEPVRLVEVVEQQENEWRGAFEEADRQLIFEVGDEIVLMATPGALSQVFATLIENSLHHGQGTTKVQARESASAVVIEISDEGDGVSDELAPQVFEREITSGDGTGLGLALARDLVTADGGRLELAQRRPPVFQVFLSRVPRSLDPEAVLPIGSPVEAYPERRRRRWKDRRRAQK